jgi:hypothetical protein
VMEQITGFMKIQAPPNAVPSHVYLASGRIVQPDANSQIVVAPGDARPLLAAGWQLVPGPR